jgi:hypothetical protein
VGYGLRLYIPDGSIAAFGQRKVPRAGFAATQDDIINVIVSNVIVNGIINGIVSDESS